MPGRRLSVTSENRLSDQNQNLMKENETYRNQLADLKSRGFQNAGLYDPPGVGGTHVMYVLHHADKPSLYSGLPDNPRISPLVGLWKGVMKPISLAVIAFAGAFGLMHYVTRGPNRVTEHDEEEATKLEKTKGA